MRLTLKSLQTEMRSSFSEMSLRIDKLDVNLNERVDSISLKLDKHIKETASAFRSIDERFNEIDRRFDAIDRKFDGILDSLFPYFTNIEKMLANHEERIIVLEKKH